MFDEGAEVGVRFDVPRADQILRAIQPLLF
jgi:hypothetical protein